MFNGKAISAGYGIGKAYKIEAASLDYSNVKYTSAEQELERIRKAKEIFIEETTLLEERLKETAGANEAFILRGHIMMLNDPFVVEKIREYIEKGFVAEKALDTVSSVYISIFSNVKEEFVRQRIQDIRDVRDRMLEILINSKPLNYNKIPPGSVLIAKEISPSILGSLNRDNIIATVTESGSGISHSAILARAMGIPAVSCEDIDMKSIREGDTVIVDGSNGLVIDNPTAEQIQKYEKFISEYAQNQELLKVYINKPTVTLDGQIKHVYGNIATEQDAARVISNGGEGIGLFRTEFIFMDRFSSPDEDEQYEIYSKIIRKMKKKPVVIRTLDIGGDKVIPYLYSYDESNPFMGYRAIRFCLDNPEFFKVQIRAILRAAVFGNVKILIPFITSEHEVKLSKMLIKECERELADEGKKFKSVPMGIMIETPSAAIMSDVLVNEVDFISIGTNDLTAYIMAADRSNEKLSAMYNSMQPAVLRAIEMAVKNAKEAGIPVSICGEAAANNNLLIKFMQMGINDFSVNSESILKIRKTICNTRL